MKRKVLFLSMVLLGLIAPWNTADATNISGMTPEVAETQGFWARLTAKPATTTSGQGKVFVIADDDYSSDPSDGEYKSVSSSDGFSDVFVMTSLLDADVHFRAFAKANAGSYFTGWSFTDGYTDLGNGKTLYTKVTPSSKKAHSNIREYIVYAAFEPIRLVSYAITGNNTNVKVGSDWTCTQTVTFRAETPGVDELSNIEDSQHFKRPKLTKKSGTTGTWSIGDAEWITSGANQNFIAHGSYAELIVPVSFKAPNGNPAEYGAELTLETYAGVKMKVYLSARTDGGDGEAIRYDKNKVEQARGSLTDMISSASATDIVKLNGDYSSSVSINKSLTFDLNGYTLNNTLTISAGEVTLAYSPYGGSANALNVTGGKALLNGGTLGSMTIGANGIVEQNGAIITGTASNNGSLTTTDGQFQSGLSSSKTLLLNGGSFTNNSGVAVTISGGTAQINRAEITGSTYGLKTTGGATSIEKLATITGSTKALQGAGGTLTVNNGKFDNPDNLKDGTIVFNAGFFRTASGQTVLGKQVWRNTAGPEYREGYEFFAGSQDAAQASNVSVCRIGKTAYSSLEDALAYANNSGKEVFIIMENDYSLKAGYYTLPANATLIVPMSNDQQEANQIVPRGSGAPAPVSFRKLIFENGVNFEVAGTIELTCTQYGSGTTMGVPGGNFGHLILKQGSHMTLNDGGELRAWGFVSGDGTKDADGNYLSGEIDARRGSIVREMFQMGDWKGGNISFTLIMDQAPQNMTHLFPIYMYFIQNVESPVKYHPGSSLICATSVNVASNVNAYANDIKVVGKNGEAAMFLMDEMADAENTWVRKFYDAKNDKQVYEVNSGARLGSLVVDLGELPAAIASSYFHVNAPMNIKLDSRKFVLPLTSNMKIHLLSGSMQFTQSTSCLPGMEVEVDKESEISIIPSEDPNVLSGALYLYDADQWSFANTPSLGGYVGNSKGKFGAVVRYSATLNAKPTVRDVSSPAAIGDAKLIVHGTFRSTSGCSVYTTWSKGTGTTLEDNPFTLNTTTGTGGASIISTNADAGTFIFDDASPEFDGVHWDDPANFGQLEHMTGIGNSVLVNYDNNNYGSSDYPIAIGTALHPEETTRMFGWELCTPAMLKNGDGSFAATEGTVAGQSYCYMNDRWTTMTVAEDYCFMEDNYGTFYAKPAEYVAVSGTVEDGWVIGNDDHTYSDKAGAGRLFILMNDCQWWEVEKKDNLYHCIHPNNDTYYYWDEDDEEWKEKRFTITWKNWDGTELKSYTYDAVTGAPTEVDYNVTYGTQAVYLGSNPTREATIDYTYDFTGWSPALGKVTSDITYTATYTEQPRKYTIIFTNEGGDEIERHFLTHNEMPVCENVPTRTGCTLQWEPEIAAVVGDATYRATWLENPPTEYAITFFDYDGKTKLKPTGSTPYMVAVGATPVAPANPNGKPSTAEFTYTFDHWSPAIEKVSATSAKSYTAVYREQAQTYTIRFFQENGTTQIGEAQSLVYGAMPVAPTTGVEKQNPQVGYTYTYVWQNKADASKTIETVKKNADYKAVFTATKNKYTVTLKSNPSEACEFTGAGIYEYGDAISISQTANTGYTFMSWTDGNGAVVSTLPTTVTSDITLTANFSYAGPETTYTIIWKNENGSANLIAPVTQKENTATTYTGATPTKDATAAKTYTFYGWSTKANGAGTIYKNGLTPVATANATYYAYFKETARLYNITWMNEAGNVNLELDLDQPYGATIAFNSATPTKTPSDQYSYTFDGWSTSVGGSVVSLPAKVTADATYYAHFSSTTNEYVVSWLNEDGSVIDQTKVAYGVVPTHADATKEADSEYTYTFAGWNPSPVAVTGPAAYKATFTKTPVVVESDLVIGATDVENLSVATTKTNLIITSNGTESGQLIGANNLTLTGNADFVLEQAFRAGRWYCIAVPWSVEANGGIYLGTSGTPAALDTDFEICYYDGAERAANGKVDACWVFMKNLSNAEKVLEPGRAYMIWLKKGNVNKITFRKKAGAQLLTTTTSVYQYASANTEDAGWNAIAHPALFHAYVNTGSGSKAQRYLPESDSYELLTLNDRKLIVGEPVYVQASADKTIVVTYGASYNGAPARRASANTNTEFEVSITAAGATKYADHIAVQINEDKKENGYVIGQDLVKFGVSTKVAQMWIERYNTKLCFNTVAPEDESAEYPLGIFAPKAGEYTISNQSSAISNEDYTLYLTYDGEAIWNLSESAFIANLNKGTDSHYGLRIKVNAPQMPMGIDEAIINNKEAASKVLIDNQVFIIREGKVYTITGAKVK